MENKIEAYYKKHTLVFKTPSGTSRGILKTKDSWFLILKQNNPLDSERPYIGIGECSILEGLSVDPVASYEHKLQWVCDHIHKGVDFLYDELFDYPSIQFAVEVAFSSLSSAVAFNDSFLIFPSTNWTTSRQSIPINGLIWMGSYNFMFSQLEKKLADGYNCIKLKIGAIDFDKELALLSKVRERFSSQELVLRVDANGAFPVGQALSKLEALSEFDLHSIEQPIGIGQYSQMKDLCKCTPVPIALDEELIGIKTFEQKKQLLEQIRPQYIILKPSLIGGFKGCQDWIRLCDDMQIGWWMTSALESNIGLNAIAQFAVFKKVTSPQGLGTGSLYTNNIASPLVVQKQGSLFYDNSLFWDLSLF